MGEGKKGLNKGPWTREEDQKLLAYIEEHGRGSWRTLPAKAGLERCGKSCRLRWTNYLRPDIKRGKFNTHEEKTIVRLHALLGNRWSAIAAHLPQRTDNEIKNYWNTRLKKRLTRMGIDPVTHKPKNNPAGWAQSRHAAALSHTAQWETTRLEAEARLTRESKLVSDIRLLHRAIAPPPPPPPPCLDVLKVWQATTFPSCFLSSPGTLESPTSTLNFSSTSLTVPTIGSVMANDIVFNDGATCKLQVTAPPMGVVYTENYAEMEGKMENSQQDDRIVGPMSYDLDVMGAMDHSSLFDHDSDLHKMGGPDMWEYEEGSHNYWNELLDLVCTTIEPPAL